MVGKSSLLFVFCGFGCSALDDEDAMLQMVHLGERMKDLTLSHSHNEVEDLADEQAMMDLADEQAMMDLADEQAVMNLADVQAVMNGADEQAMKDGVTLCQPTKKFPATGYGHIDYEITDMNWHWTNNKGTLGECLSKCRMTPGCKSIDFHEDVYNGNRGGRMIRACNLRNCTAGEADCPIAKPAKWQLADAECDADPECKGKRFTVHTAPECDYVPGKHNHSCPDGYTEVTTASGCEAAQDALAPRTRAKTGGGRWYLERTNTNPRGVPKGCSWPWGSEENFAIYFNNGVDGTHGGFKAMCKRNPPPTPAPTPEPAPVVPAPAVDIKWLRISSETQGSLASQSHDGTAKCDAFCSSKGMGCNADSKTGDWKPAADGSLTYATEDQGEVTCDSSATRTTINTIYPKVEMFKGAPQCWYVEARSRPGSENMFCTRNIFAGDVCPCQQEPEPEPAPVLWTALSSQTAGNTQSVPCNALCASMGMECKDNYNTGDWKPAADGSLKFATHDQAQAPTVVSCADIHAGGTNNHYPYTNISSGVVNCWWVSNGGWFASPRQCSRSGSVGNLCPCLLTQGVLQTYPQLQDAR